VRRPVGAFAAFADVAQQKRPKEKGGGRRKTVTKKSGDRSPHSKGDAILAVHFGALIPNYG
jgi:hypothetical protein